MIEDISFKQYKKKNDIHGTVLYPAVMVAPIQNAILRDLLKENNINSVFDPFHGSGTSLYECAEISKNIRLVGCDINPLANLITKVKLQGVSSNFFEDFQVLKETVNNLKHGDEHTFEKIDKWFKPNVIHALRRLRTSIMRIDDDKNRLFFWYMLCDVIRRNSNTRSSTYKLHIKDYDAITRLDNDVIKEYFSSIEKSWDKFLNCYSNVELYKSDIIQQIRQFNDREFDITITSPPYGDNGTTVPYGQFSILSLLWIDEKDLALEGWERKNFSVIDSKSLGGYNSACEFNAFEMSLIEPYINNISAHKQKKVFRFFSDYFDVLQNICRVTDKHIVMTLGNRTVDRIKINLNDITRVFLEHHGFRHINTYERDIPMKRTPKTTSRIMNRPVESMNSEFISLFDRL